jgi:hypothetical protein
VFTLPESPLSRQIKSRWTVLVTAGLAKNLVRSEHGSQKPVERELVVHPIQPPVPCGIADWLPSPQSALSLLVVLYSKICAHAKILTSRMGTRNEYEQCLLTRNCQSLVYV